MVLRINVILVVLMVSLFVVESTISKELEKYKKKYRYGNEKNKTYINRLEHVVDFITGIYRKSTVVFLIMSLVNIISLFFMAKIFWPLIIASIFYIIGFIFMKIEDKVEMFGDLLAGIGIFFLICYFMAFIIAVIFGCSETINEDYAIETVYCETIDILEFQETTYGNTRGYGRSYIRTSPSNAYYYEIRTENGGTTTEVIDGAVAYVEKIQDDQYLNNPHIDVYQEKTIKTYTNYYGITISKIVQIKECYYIYIPKNGITFCTDNQ